MKMNPQVQFRRQAVAPLVRPDSLDFNFMPAAEQILAVTVGPSHYHYQTHPGSGASPVSYGYENLDLRILSQRVRACAETMYCVFII